MHGEVDGAGEQRLLDFLGEEPLAAGLGQRPVLNDVAGGADDADLDPLGVEPAAAARRLCTSRACTSASGEPREPMRRMERLAIAIGLRCSIAQDAYNTPMIILGIETTCDETAAAVVERTEDGRGRILSNVVLSQISEHAEFGGVVPEIAARAHVEALDPIIAKAMSEAQVSFAALDGIAAAAGPGLIGGVIVGLTTAKAIALVHDKPLIAVNHLEAHALTARLTDGTPFPYCLFLASGGHTQILGVRGVGDYLRLGGTVDDAIGEAFDKTAKLLGLGYPGGPLVEKEAAHGDPERFALPRPMAGRHDANFSLSGLKTALRLEAEKIAPLERCRTSPISARRSSRRSSMSSWTGCASGCACSASASARRPRWFAPAASRPTRRSARSCIASPSRSARSWWRRRRLCAPTTAP